MTKVSKLLRLHGSEQYPAKWYYTPDGHSVGPFKTDEEMEADIAKHYVEETPRTDFTTEDWT